VLLPFAWLFALFSRLRRAAYAAGIFSVVDTGVPVVVVGNITVGGTGKTPVVAWLADQLTRRGYRPGIVSRGYGGSTTAGPARLVTASSLAAECGDEPVLLARMTSCPVAVSRDRVAAVEKVREQGVDVVIADDGLQHYRLHRDVEIVVVDGERMFGNGRRLPAGPLRESPQRLASVDAVMVNGGHEDAGRGFSLRVADAVRLDGSEVRALSAFSGASVWGVAAIGNPERFYNALRTHGIDVKETLVADHGVIDLSSLLREKVMPVFMTEKDAVKYTAAGHEDVWYVPAVLEMPEADATALLDVIIRQLPAKHETA
jgi:tetraacyldisaccharide 4'-kinase